MKKRDLVRHIEKSGCLFVREGAKHTVYVNPANKKTSTVPRHTEIKNMLCLKICKDLGIDAPF